MNISQLICLARKHPRAARPSRHVTSTAGSSVKPAARLQKRRSLTRPALIDRCARAWPSSCPAAAARNSPQSCRSGSRLFGPPPPLPNGRGDRLTRNTRRHGRLTTNNSSRQHEQRPTGRRLSLSNLHGGWRRSRRRKLPPNPQKLNPSRRDEANWGGRGGGSYGTESPRRLTPLCPSVSS